MRIEELDSRYSGRLKRRPSGCVSICGPKKGIKIKSQPGRNCYECRTNQRKNGKVGVIRRVRCFRATVREHEKGTARR